MASKLDVSSFTPLTRRDDSIRAIFNTGRFEKNTFNSDMTCSTASLATGPWAGYSFSLLYAPSSALITRWMSPNPESSNCRSPETDSTSISSAPEKPPSLADATFVYLICTGWTYLSWFISEKFFQYCGVISLGSIRHILPKRIISSSSVNPLTKVRHLICSRSQKSIILRAMDWKLPTSIIWPLIRMLFLSVMTLKRWVSSSTFSTSWVSWCTELVTDLLSGGYRRVFRIVTSIDWSSFGMYFRLSSLKGTSPISSEPPMPPSSFSSTLYRATSWSLKIFWL